MLANLSAMDTAQGFLRAPDPEETSAGTFSLNWKVLPNHDALYLHTDMAVSSHIFSGCWMK